MDYDDEEEVLFDLGKEEVSHPDFGEVVEVLVGHAYDEVEVYLGHEYIP